MRRERLAFSETCLPIERLGLRVADTDFKHDHRRTEPLRLGFDGTDKRGANATPAGSDVHDHALQFDGTAASLECATSK